MYKYFLLLLLSSSWAAEIFQNGDLIFHHSKSNQSRAIQIATNSELTHMGIVVKLRNQWFVYEAVQPVKLTPLKSWIQRGVDGKFSLKRLNPEIKKISELDIQAMMKEGDKYKGKNIPLNEMVISPISMFNSDKLLWVYEGRYPTTSP